MLLSSSSSSKGKGQWQRQQHESIVAMRLSLSWSDYLLVCLLACLFACLLVAQVKQNQWPTMEGMVEGVVSVGISFVRSLSLDDSLHTTCLLWWWWWWRWRRSRGNDDPKHVTCVTSYEGPNLLVRVSVIYATWLSIYSTEYVSVQTRCWFPYAREGTIWVREGIWEQSMTNAHVEEIVQSSSW